MMGAGPQNLTNPSNYTKYKASGLGVWPSLIVLSDAEVRGSVDLAKCVSHGTE